MRVATIFSGIPFILTLYAFTVFDFGTAGMQFVERLNWVPQVGISYFLGVDGISLALLFVTGLLTLLSMLASWEIKDRVKEYFALMLFLEVGMLGVFVALDYIIFYIFWEITLVPMYFLIGIWGGPRREYAAIKFFVYTLLGSVLMLLSILALYFYADINSFDILRLQEEGQLFRLALQIPIFLGFYAGFAVKIPLFPFHTWLPDAHVEAPTAVSVILAGVLLKMGGYGFLRISMPTFPNAWEYLATTIAILALINIVYGAYVAMAQRDLKKLVAYSSISHMGFIILGLVALNEAGFDGAMFQMISHALTTGMLFLLVGIVYSRAHTRIIADLGGLQGQVPIFAGILAFDAMASLGLPGLSGFIGEFFVLMGAISSALHPAMAVIAALSIVLTAGYLLWMIQRVSLGSIGDKVKKMKDLTAFELAYLAPLVVLIVLFGVYPALLLNVFDVSINSLLTLWG
ncbi:MAG: NuoM family protein [Terriglobia bacterium]